MGLIWDNKFTRTATGVGMGLLSERSGEGWAPALSRGLGLAAQNLENYENEQIRDQEMRWEADRQRRVEDQEYRDDNLRMYYADIATDPTASPEDRAAAEAAMDLSGAALGSYHAQMSAASSNIRSAESARKSRIAEAKVNREENSKLRTRERIATEKRKANTPQAKDALRARYMIAYQDTQHPLHGDAATELDLPVGGVDLGATKQKWLDNHMKLNQERIFTDRLFRGMNERGRRKTVDNNPGGG